MEFQVFSLSLVSRISVFGICSTKCVHYFVLQFCPSFFLSNFYHQSFPTLPPSLNNNWLYQCSTQLVLRVFQRALAIVLLISYWLTFCINKLSANRRVDLVWPSTRYYTIATPLFKTLSSFSKYFQYISNFHLAFSNCFHFFPKFFKIISPNILGWAVPSSYPVDIG